MGSTTRLGNTELSDPPLLTAIFNDLRYAWVWLLVRLYLAYEWLEPAFEKLHSKAWTETGLAVKGFWTKAVVIPPPPARPPIAFDWYRSVIEALIASDSHVWFAKLIMVSEFAIGIALLLGAFTAFAAFAGGFMNWNFIMAGTASVNGVLLPLQIFLILAWKTAGWWGADRWLLQRLGTPWDKSGMFGNGAAHKPEG